MKTTLLILLSSAFIILASWLTFASSNRYGIHSDSASCGENKSHEIFYTATSYILTTQTYERDKVKVGTCQYENFTARTFALDLWIPAIAFGFISYKRIDRSRRNHREVS
ncbi:hypothetical protein D3C73_104020 [compost metagenome]